MNSADKTINKRTVMAWALYDWANSAFTTSIQTVLFGLYFVNAVVPAGGVGVGGFTVSGASLWSYLNAAVMVTVLLGAPFLGMAADRWHRRHSFFVVSASVGSVLTMILFWATPGRLAGTSAAIFLALIFYELSLVFYNSFLNDISSPETVGRVSGLGFALGYIGGGLCLALNLWMVAAPASFGLGGADTALALRFSFVVVGVWWFLFSLPAFLNRGLASSNQSSMRHSGEGGNPVLSLNVETGSRLDPGLRHAGMTDLEASPFRLLTALFRVPEARRFLLAYFFYNDAIQTIILLSAVFGGRALGMTTRDLGACYLMIQFVAFGGARFMGAWADRVGHKKVVLVSIGLFSAAVVWAFFMTRQLEFWGLGVLVGLVLGGSQAASRSLFSFYVPAEASAASYSLFSVVGKASSIMGPIAFGLTNDFFGIRYAVLSLLPFFVIGTTLLWPLKEPSAP